MYVLLEALLLVRLPRTKSRLSIPGVERHHGEARLLREMRNRVSISLPSNEPSLASAVAPRAPMNYTEIAQTAVEVQSIQNAPSVSMGEYLISSGQTRLLTTLSVYSLRGSSREKLRLLYMNATALRLWKEMGRQPTVLGERHRPPAGALLTFGVPFSE